MGRALLTKLKTMTEPSLIKTFVAGGVGGACLVLIGHPLDTIKVRNFLPERDAKVETCYNLSHRYS